MLCKQNLKWMNSFEGVVRSKSIFYVIKLERNQFKTFTRLAWKWKHLFIVFFSFQYLFILTIHCYCSVYILFYFFFSRNWHPCPNNVLKNCKIFRRIVHNTIRPLSYKHFKYHTIFNMCCRVNPDVIAKHLYNYECINIILHV